MLPSELLQQLRRMYPTTAALARALNVTRQALGMLMQGQRQPCDFTIIKAAALMGIDPGPALCMAAAARSTDPTTSATWAALAQKITAANPAAPHPEQANQTPKAPENTPAPAAKKINQAPEPVALPAPIMPSECGDFYYVKYLAVAVYALSEVFTSLLNWLAV